MRLWPEHGIAHWWQHLRGTNMTMFDDLFVNGTVVEVDVVCQVCGERETYLNSDASPEAIAAVKLLHAVDAKRYPASLMRTVANADKDNQLR